MFQNLPTTQTAAYIKQVTQDPNGIIFDHQFAVPTSVEPDEVLIRNKFAGVNPCDSIIRKTGILLTGFPAILGVDFSGIIVGCGSDVTKFKIGDSVSGCSFGNFKGTYAQYILCKESSLAHNPPNLPDEICGSGGGTFMTAFQVLSQYFSSKKSEKGSLQGQRLLLIGGSGGVGSAAILLAKHYFKALEIVSISSGRNEEYLKGLGVDRVLDYTKGKSWLVEELEKLEGHFDLVADLIGGYQEYYGIEILKKDAESLFVTIIQSLPENGGSVFGCERTLNYYEDSRGYEYEMILNWLDETKLWKTIPIQILPLEKVVQSHEMIETKRTVGKIVLQIP